MVTRRDRSFKASHDPLALGSRRCSTITFSEGLNPCRIRQCSTIRKKESDSSGDWPVRRLYFLLFSIFKHRPSVVEDPSSGCREQISLAKVIVTPLIWPERKKGW